MKQLFVIALLALTSLSAQTKVNLGAGLLEESNKNGAGVSVEAGVHQELIKNAGLSVIYTKGFPYRGKFQQLQLMAYYNIEADHSLNLKLNYGIARQINGNIYPTFGVDLLARCSEVSQIYLSFSPVGRGGFRDKQTGWSHTVTVGLLIKILE